MAFTQNDIGKPCPFCGYGTIGYFKSGKIGCQAKCWLRDNKPPVQPQNPSPLPNLNPQGDKIAINTEILLVLQDISRKIEITNITLSKLLDSLNENLGR